jgi:ATP-binding cassette, subfamily B, bacterial
MIYSPEIPSTLKHFIWRYLKKNKRLMIGILAMFMIYALESSISPYLLGKMVSVVSNYGSSKQFLSLIILPAIFYAMMPMITNIAVRLKEYFEACLYPSMKSDIKKDMLEHIMTSWISLNTNKPLDATKQ